MKKYVAYLIFAFAVMFVLPSCENRTGIDFAENTLTLTLSCNNLGLTRATENGDDNLNENTVNSIDCYFYPLDANFNNTHAVLVKDNITALTETTEGTYTANIKFEETELTALFGTVAEGGSAQCLIYVIANRPDDVTLPTGKPTINELKALTITSNFIDDNKKFVEQSSFVMDSDATPDSDNDTGIDNDDIVIYYISENGTKSLKATVPLYRTAAKITLNINRFGPEKTPGEVVFDGVVYKPVLNSEDYPIKAFLHNGVTNSIIAPDVEDILPENFQYKYADYEFLMVNEGEGEKSLEKPFYSYASNWSESDEHEAYITLIVPWGVATTDENNETVLSDIREYYYKIPINYEGKKLLRNTHYKISISVSILGTLDPTSTVIIEPSYTILDWSEDEVETSMSDFRYLMVEKNSYVMDNVNTIEIPYWTSHNCTIVNVSVTKPDLYNGGGKTINVTSGYNLSLKTKDGDAYITYSKVLDNVYTSSTFDFAPYTITFRIQQTTQSTTYYEDITITQYPAIYGEYEENSDYTNGKDNNSKGYVYVNGYQGDNAASGYDFFCSVPGNSRLDENPPVSPNRYIFTVTSVAGTPYVIGDPRDMEVTYDENDARWYNAREIINGITNNIPRELQNYYGTDVTSTKYDNATNRTGTIYATDAAAEAEERTINMVAPKFMIASGYALLSTGTESQTLENLKKRCASYQEDGYPAGRWRLPTRAEFQLIMSQVDKRTLPAMYVVNTEYWCAHGVGTPQGNGVIDMEYVGYDSSGHSTRCVYDLWYWGEHDKMDPGTTTFTWGDVPRSEKAYAPSINY